MKKYLAAKKSEFAPREIVILAQIAFIILGLLLVQTFNIPIGVYPLQLTDLVLVLGIAILIALISMWTVNKQPVIKNLLYWSYGDHLKSGYLWSFILFPGLIALGEEIFFRGLIQPSLGVVFTAMVASLYHIRVSRNAIYLIAVAFFMNIIFGYLYETTGNLLVPILLHYEFHLFNIVYIRRIGR